MITPQYRSDIDGLRGIAVIMAVFFHAFPTVLGGGFIGVEIFFVVSGFLIGTILLQSTTNGSFTYSEFYARRIRRIFPALFVVLAACSIAGWNLLLTQEYQQLSKHVLAGAGFISNFAHWDEVNYFDTAAETKPLLHLWSLGVEEQFYIFLPPLLLLIVRFGLRTKTTIALLWVLSFAANLYITSIDRTQAFYSPFPRLWELLTGCLLAAFYLEPQNPISKWVIARRDQQWLIECIAVTGVALIAVPTLLLHRGTSNFPGVWTLYPVIGTALLVMVGLRSWINRKLLANPTLVWVGQISYPLYLWHWPLLSGAHMLEGKVPSVETRLLLIAVSFVLAALTWRYIERPARTGRWKEQAVPVLSVLMLAVAGAGAVIWQVDTSSVRSFAKQETFLKVQSLFNFINDKQYALASCGDNAAIVGRARAICSTSGIEGDGPLLVLWGDSHVRSWAPVFAKIAQERQLRLVKFSFPGCAPLLQVRRTDVLEEGCSPQLAADVMASIENLKPAQVVLISNWNIFINGLVVGGVLQQATHFLTDQADGEADHITSQAAFQRQFPATVNRILATGASVLALKAPPILHEPMWSGYVRHRDTYEPSRQEYLQATMFSNKAIDAATSDPKVRSFDVSQYLCGDSKCNAVYEGTMMYGDDNHLTTIGAMIFKPQLEQVVIPALQRTATLP